MDDNFPSQAGVQFERLNTWVPAFAGTTNFFTMRVTH